MTAAELETFRVNIPLKNTLGRNDKRLTWYSHRVAGCWVVNRLRRGAREIVGSVGTVIPRLLETVSRILLVRCGRLVPKRSPPKNCSLRYQARDFSAHTICDEKKKKRWPSVTFLIIIAPAVNHLPSCPIRFSAADPLSYHVSTLWASAQTDEKKHKLCLLKSTQHKSWIYKMWNIVERSSEKSLSVWMRYCVKYCNNYLFF